MNNQIKNKVLTFSDAIKYHKILQDFSIIFGKRVNLLLARENIEGTLLVPGYTFRERDIKTFLEVHRETYINKLGLNSANK